MGLYPLREGYNGGIIARRLSLITAVQIFYREGLEMFAVLWYNGSSKKPPRRGAYGSCEVGENMELGF